MVPTCCLLVCHFLAHPVVVHCVYTGPDVHRRLRTLNKCPLQRARWCVISDYEMMKCENMIMAFAAKNLKPDLNCIRGSSVEDCMYKIKYGDADLITLYAADVYFAGKLVFATQKQSRFK